jgi:hypothetical protein
MSEHDIEHVFEQASSSIETPDEKELRARARAAAAHPRPTRGRRPRVTPARAAAAVVLALLLGSALGFGVASSLTPSGSAADPAPGLGFLPERGWNVARTRFDASPERPSFAFAANVPFARLDLSLAKRLDFSGTTHYTLQTLRPGGIVLVASFSLRGVHEPSDESFPRRALPLRLRDAVSPLAPGGSGGRYGHYELRAAVGEHNVIVNVYFGTPRPSRPQVIAAQRQLDRLVVGETRAMAKVVADRALPLKPSAAAPVATGSQSLGFVRTFSCLPLAAGALRDLDFDVSPNRTDVAGRPVTAVIEARTGAQLPTTSLVFARARTQPANPGVGIQPVRGVAGAFASRTRCRPARSRVPLSARGLPGPPVEWEKRLDCRIRGRVLVRLRATLDTPTAWRRVDATFSGARNPVVRAQLAVRSERTGKPIAYMELDAKGRTKLWYSGACS